jgi:two-component system nitrate/nitrite response regulator NarL
MSSRVLVVDDDESFRALARRMLEALGIVVVGEAGTVSAALSEARALEPDAALVDVGLPDGDGVELARALSALPCGPRIVLTSSDPDAVSSEEARRSGVGAFIAKADLPSAPLARLLASV